MDESKAPVAFKVRNKAKGALPQKNDGAGASADAGEVRTLTSSSSSSSTSFSLPGYCDQIEYVSEGELDQPSSSSFSSDATKRSSSSSSSSKNHNISAMGNRSVARLGGRVTCFDDDEDPSAYLARPSIGDKKSKAAKLFKKVLQNAESSSAGGSSGGIEEPKDDAAPVYLGGSYSKESLSALRQVNIPNPEKEKNSAGGGGEINRHHQMQDVMEINGEEGFNEDVMYLSQQQHHRDVVVETFQLSGAAAEQLEDEMAAREDSEMLDHEERSAATRMPSHPLSNRYIESYIGGNSYNNDNNRDMMDLNASSTSAVMDDLRVAAMLSTKKHKGASSEDSDMSRSYSNSRVYTDNLKATLDNNSTKQSRRIDMYNSMSRSDSQESEDWENIVMKRAMASSSSTSTFNSSGANKGMAMFGGKASSIGGVTRQVSFGREKTGLDVDQPDRAGQSKMASVSIADMKSLLIDARDKIQSNISSNELRVSQLQDHLSKYENDKLALVAKMNDFVKEFNIFKEIRQFFVDLVSLLRAKAPMIETLLNTQINIWRDTYYKPLHRKRVRDQNHLLASMARSGILHDVDVNFTPTSELQNLVRELQAASITSDNDTPGDTSSVAILDCFKSQVASFGKLFDPTKGEALLPSISYIGMGTNNSNSSNNTNNSSSRSSIDITPNDVRGALIIPQSSPSFFALFDKFHVRVLGRSSDFCGRMSSTDVNDEESSGMATNATATTTSSSTAAISNLSSPDFLESNIDDIVGLIDHLETEFLYDFETLHKSGDRLIASSILQNLDTKLSTISRATSIIFDDVDEELHLSSSILSGSRNNLEDKEKATARGGNSYSYSSSSDNSSSGSNSSSNGSSNSSSSSSSSNGGGDMETEDGNSFDNKIKLTNCSGLLTVSNYLRRNFGEKYASTFVSEAMPDLIRTFLLLPLFSSRNWLSPLHIDNGGKVVLNFSKENFRCNFEKILDYEMIRDFSMESLGASKAATSSSSSVSSSSPSRVKLLGREDLGGGDSYEGKLDETLLPRVISKAWTPMLVALIEQSFDVNSIINSIQCRNYVLQAVLFCDKGNNSSLLQITSALVKRISTNLDAIVVPLPLLASPLVSQIHSSSTTLISSSGPLCLPSLRPLLRISLRRLCKALMCSFLVCEGIVQRLALFKIVYQCVLVRRRNIWKLFCRETLDLATQELFLALLSVLCVSIPDPGHTADLTRFGSRAVAAEEGEESNYNLFLCLTDIHGDKSLDDRNKIATSLILLQSIVGNKILTTQRHQHADSAPICEQSTIESVVKCVGNILRVI